jgi:hypothetical protein
MTKLEETDMAKLEAAFFKFYNMHKNEGKCKEHEHGGIQLK